MYDRAVRITRPPPEHIDPWIAGRVLDTILRHQIANRETTRSQPIAEKTSARLIGFTGRIDGGNPHQVGREIDDLVSGLLDLVQDTFDRAPASFR